MWLIKCTWTGERFCDENSKGCDKCHTLGLFAPLLGRIKNTGPIPPRVDEATTYTIVWNVQNKGSAVAGGIVSAVLPNYVTYTEATAGAGSFSYNDASHTVTWNTGDLAQGASVQGVFQVSLIPSISQRESAVSLTKAVSFSGYDRFAGVQIDTTADSVTIETKGGPRVHSGEWECRVMV